MKDDDRKSAILRALHRVRTKGMGGSAAPVVEVRIMAGGEQPAEPSDEEDEEREGEE